MVLSYPSSCNDGMDLRGAVDAEDGDSPVFAEFGGGVGMGFNFRVYFGAGGKETGVVENAFGRSGGEEGIPGCDDVELGSPPC